MFSIVISVLLAALAWSWDDLGPTWRALIVGAGSLALLLFWFARTHRETPRAAPNPLTEILELVVSDESRRPWNPTTLPWLPTGVTPKPILLVPAADYHLAEIVPLAHELEARGHGTRVAVGPSPWGRTWQALHWYPGLALHALPDPDQVARDSSLVVTMKDTGSLTDWVTDVRALGTPVVGKVEGAQDFWDSDTPDERRPYRNLDLVLCQGELDADALADRKTAIVGSTRLERLWWAPPVVSRRPLAVINLNFVYGVRTSDRDLWLETAISGCETAGIPYVVSVHPAERTRLSTNRTTRVAAARLLPHATVLISRFSTLPFEAMARGVPFVYHNPHGETVTTFADPMGAFQVSTDADSLARALSSLDPAGEASRNGSRVYFEHVIDVASDRRSEERGATSVLELLGGRE